ncbi:MAG: hypothetical protein GX335_00660 [Firmicutes bacterium]|nr:hypothetical protein [Bacillota bacterium]
MQRFGKLFLALLLLGLLNAVDFLATGDLVILGGLGEWNPLLRGIVGTAYFAVLKLVFVPLSLVFLWAKRDLAAGRFWGLLKFTCGVYLAAVAYILFVFYL